MRIDVTQEHIDEGEPNSTGFCPIALAMKDKGGTGICVAFDYATAQEIDGREFVISQMSAYAREFIRQFDYEADQNANSDSDSDHWRKAFEPFSFDLEWREREL